MCIRELQCRDRDEDLRRRHDDVSAELPDDVDGFAGIETRIEPGRQQEGWHREEQSKGDLPQRREGPKPLKCRVNHTIEQRDEQKHQGGIEPLRLRRVPVHYEVPVHSRCLQDPCRALLIEQRPEHRDERIDDEELAKRCEAFAAEHFPQKPDAARGNVYELISAHPEHERRKRHQHSRHTKRDRRAEAMQEGLGKQDRRERSHIDREVEPAKDLG